MGLRDLVSGLTQGNEGNAQGLQDRQNAVKQINSGALSNTPASTPASTSQTSNTTVKRNPSNQYGSRPGEVRYKLGKDGAILGQFKKGGKVKKTGNYKLHKGERVLNPKQTKKAEKGGLLRALMKKG